MFNQIALLFNGMTGSGIAVAGLVFLIAGICMIFVEELMPGFGVFGILGIIFTITGMVLRVLCPVCTGHWAAQIGLMAFFQVAFAGVGWVIVLLLARLGILEKTPFVQTATAVDVERSDGTADYSYLVGTEGVATTDLRPVGKGVFSGKTYDVDSDGTFITKGDAIRVEHTEGVRIRVAKA